MEPTLKKYSLVFTKKEQIYEIEDICTYLVKNQKFPITHRIVERKLVGNKAFYIFKGDRNPEKDPYLISPKEIQGKVIWNGNLSSIIVNSMSNPKIMWVTFYLPLGYLTGYLIRKI